MEILTSLERSGVATWIRESPSIWGYPTILTLHTVGLAVLVGANWALDLRLLGVARQIPLTTLEQSFRVMWIGFWINALSGVALFAADATTKGTTSVFMWKLGLIAVGVVVIALLKKIVYGQGVAPVAGPAARTLAAVSLALWVVAIALGRWMAYAA
jgi:hypothetical protein